MSMGIGKLISEKISHRKVFLRIHDDGVSVLFKRSILKLGNQYVVILPAKYREYYERLRKENKDVVVEVYLFSAN